MKRLLVLALVGQLTFAAAAPASAQAPDIRPAPPEAMSRADVTQRAAVDRLFNAIRKAVEKIVARLTAAEHVELVLLRVDRDDRHRMYLDFEGEVDLKFPRIARRLEKYMDDLAGHHVLTDGPLNIDYLVTVVERTAEDTWHVEFRVNVIVVLEAVLSKMVKFGTEVLGTVTLMGLGDTIAGLVEGMDTSLVAEALQGGLQDMYKVLLSLAGVEAYDAWRGFRRDRDSMAVGESSAGTVMVHLGVTLARGCMKVGTSMVGMSLGAAIGTALFPGMGSTLGAVAGAAGLNILGNIVYKKMSIDLPVRYRLSRIRRLTHLRDTCSEDHRSYYQAKVDKQVLKLIKRVSLEMRTDRFKFLDEILEQVERTSHKDRGAYEPLRKGIEAKLSFEVVHRQDRLFARKLEQVRRAFSAGPSGVASDASVDPAPAR